MSLLEDIFLQDEAGEAQELERVIEGDEFDERPLSSSDDEQDDGKRDDEAEEDKRRVDPSTTKTKRVTKNPRFILNPARLTGPRGIQVIPEHFKDFKFKGKGHEKEDLDMVLKKLEHWAYRLYPKFQFQDCLKKIETLGKKRPVMVHLHKIRTDQYMSEETVVQKDSSDDELQPPQEEDEFDKLLQQQIELARATPGPGSVKKVMQTNDQWESLVNTPVHDNRSSLTMPKGTSSPSISDEQKERMIRNRKLAEERRLARLKQATNMNNTMSNIIIEVDEGPSSKDTSIVTTNISDTIEIIDENIVSKKNKRSNVIDSSDSDDECNMTAVKEPIVVDIHHNFINADKDAEKLINDERNMQEADKNIGEMLIDDQSISRTNECDAVETNNAHTVDITEKTNNKPDIVDKDSNLIGEDKVDKTCKDTIHGVEINNSNVILGEEVDDRSNDNDIEGVRLSNDVDSERENDRLTDEINDDVKINKNIDSNKDLISKSGTDSNIKEQNVESRDTREQIDQNSSRSAEDDSTNQKKIAEDLTDVMDVDFSDEF